MHYLGRNWLTWGSGKKICSKKLQQHENVALFFPFQFSYPEEEMRDLKSVSRDHSSVPWRGNEQKKLVVSQQQAEPTAWEGGSLDRWEWKKSQNGSEGPGQHRPRGLLPKTGICGAAVGMAGLPRAMAEHTAHALPWALCLARCPSRPYCSSASCAQPASEPTPSDPARLSSSSLESQHSNPKTTLRRGQHQPARQGRAPVLLGARVKASSSGRTGAGTGGRRAQGAPCALDERRDRPPRPGLPRSSAIPSAPAAVAALAAASARGSTAPAHNAQRRARPACKMAAERQGGRGGAEENKENERPAATRSDGLSDSLGLESILRNGGGRRGMRRDAGGSALRSGVDVAGSGLAASLSAERGASGPFLTGRRGREG